jgi:hypothetical protein
MSPENACECLATSGPPERCPHHDPGVSSPVLEDRGHVSHPSQLTRSCPPLRRQYHHPGSWPAIPPGTLRHISAI